MAGRVYEIRVAGPVPARKLRQQLGDELGDADVVEHEVRTVVSRRFVDQAALHGFLQRLRAYGLDVVEVRRVISTDEPDRIPEGDP